MALLFCLASCISGYRTVAVDVPPGGWRAPVEIGFDNADTLSRTDISLVVRHSSEVGPRTALFAVGSVAPSGVSQVDTLQITFNPSTASGNNLQETRSVFRKNVLLPEPGQYFFTVTPLQPTDGVWSIAIDLSAQH